MVKTRAFLAMALAFAIAAPPLSARNTARQQEELRQIARDLNRALGSGRAEVRGGQAPSPVPAKAIRRTGEAPVLHFADSLVAAMNRERAAYGMAPLRLNSKLSLAANDRISDMFAKRYFDHVSPDGIDPFTWVDKRGYAYRQVGENLAVGYRNANGVVDGWMHSPGHRANILKRDFDEIGVAIAAGSPARPYSGPTVVAIYGTRNS